MKKPNSKVEAPSAKDDSAGADTSSWIIREVSFATYQREEEISAKRLEQSLKLLEKGVEEWDRYREAHPRFKPGLVINKENESPVLVDDLEVAQFVHLILNHQKLRKAINAVSERGVLLLGRFKDGGYEVLQAVAAKLRELKYLPILFDFERPESRNYTETIKTLAGLARFVVVDLSGPSVPQELAATVPHFKIPFVPIIEKGRKPYSMVKDILEYPWVIRPIVQFADKEDLIKLLPAQVVQPAEKRFGERQKMLKELFEAPL
jgi:hypothetical protein